MDLGLASLKFGGVVGVERRLDFEGGPGFDFPCAAEFGADDGEGAVFVHARSAAGRVEGEIVGEYCGDSVGVGAGGCADELERGLADLLAFGVDEEREGPDCESEGRADRGEREPTREGEAREHGPRDDSCEAEQSDERPGLLEQEAFPERPVGEGGGRDAAQWVPELCEGEREGWVGHHQ